MKTCILTNARVKTFNPDTPSAEAIAISGSRVLSVGSADAIISCFGSDALIEDLGGMVVLPAFTDAHIHLLGYGLSLDRINCETSSKAECLERVRERVQLSGSGKWVLGHGWDHNIWPESAGDKQDLDAFSQDNPIYLTHKSLHSGWANSAALKAAGIHAGTKDPKDGCIERNADGEPNGIFFESAMRLLEETIPKPTGVERRNALRKSQRELLRFGITSVHDFDVWDCYLTLMDMKVSGDLRLRVVKNIPYTDLNTALEAGLISGSGNDWIKIGWLKLFSDGALGPQTAAMLQAYENSESLGMLFLTADEILEIGIKAMHSGISTAIHAIGDRANREVINGYAHLKEGGFF